MQRPIVLLVTADPEFENLAIEAVLKTGHGVRRAQSAAEAVRILSEQTDDVALGIFDLAISHRNNYLLGVLQGCAGNFPIVIVRADRAERIDEAVPSKEHFTVLSKPLTVVEISEVVDGLCRPQPEPARCRAASMNAELRAG